MKTNHCKITTCIFMLLMVIMMVACSSAGTYVGDNGTVIIKDDNTWTATLHNTDALGGKYDNHLEGELDGVCLTITKGVYQRGSDLSTVFGYLRGDKIEAYGHDYKKR